MIESSSNERAVSLANHLVVGHLEHLLPIDGVNIVPLLQASVLRRAVCLKITSLVSPVCSEKHGSSRFRFWIYLYFLISTFKTD